MLFRQVLDSISGTYTYLLASGIGRETFIAPGARPAARAKHNQPSLLHGSRGGSERFSLHSEARHRRIEAIDLEASIVPGTSKAQGSGQ